MKKIISLVTLFSIALVLLVGVASFNTKEVQAQNIGSLRNVVTSGFSFKKDLRQGDTDPDVKELQKILNSDIDTMIVTDEAGSRGRETTTFGALTKTAVIKFQNKYKDTVLTLNGLTTADGIVNKATRTKLNLLLGIMNTYDSVGLPQSRASTQVAYVPPAQVITTQPAQTGLSMCSFIDLLSSIGVLSSDRANSSRATMGCAGGAYVDLRVNGQGGSITVPKNSSVTFSWTSSGVTSCLLGNISKSLSGSEGYTVGTASRTFTFNCRTAAGASITDSVSINVSGVAPIDDEDPILLATSYTEFYYSRAEFGIDTNVPTKAYFTYWTNATDTKTVSMTTFASSREQVLTGLTPNTLYHYKVRVVDENGNEFISAEGSKWTSNYPEDDNGGAATSTPPENTSDFTQKVLTSTDGAGVVSVAGSDSLKLTSKGTFEAWVKPTAWSTRNGMSGTKDQAIISKGNIGDNIDYSLSLDNGKLVYSNNDAAMWTCSPVVPLNTWTHVAVSIDEATSTISMYVNGVKMGSATTTASTTGSYVGTSGSPLCLVSTNDSRYQVSGTSCPGAPISIVNSSTTSAYRLSTTTTGNFGLPSCITSSNDTRFPVTGSVCNGASLSIINSSTTSSYRTASTTGTGGTPALIGVSFTNITNSTASTTSAICEGSKGVFNKAAKITKSKAITNVVASFIDQPSNNEAALDFINMTAAQIAAVSQGQSATAALNPISNIHIGNFYPKMCISGDNVPKDNGFIGSLDDIRVWNTARTASQIKDNMKKSVKGKSGLVAYYTFDDGYASDVSNESNTGAIKGSFEVMEDTTATSTVVGPDYGLGEGFTLDEPCDVEPPAEPEGDEPDYNVQFAGQIMAVKQCADSGKRLVIIKGCKDSPVTNIAANPEAAAIEARDTSYYTSSDNLIAATWNPASGKEPSNKTMVFGGTSNGAWDEMCKDFTDEYDYISEGAVTYNGSGNFSVNSFSYNGQAVKSIGRIKSWDVGERGVNNCIGVGKHRSGGIRSWF